MWVKPFKTSCVLNKHEAFAQSPLSFQISLFIYWYIYIYKKDHFYAKKLRNRFKGTKKI